MTRILVLAVVLAVAGIAPAQLLTESFTDTVFPPPGWVRYNKDGGPNQMERFTTHTNTPPGCAGCLDETDRQASDWLCTPAIIAQGADTMFKWFYRGLSIGHRESISVWISHTTQELDSFNHFVEGFGVNSNSYLPESVSLGAYKGQRLFIGIEYCSDTSELNIYVDDVSGPLRFLRDVGVTSILVPPDSGLAGASFFPSFRIRNWGDSAQAGFFVHCVIRDSATGSVVFRDSAASSRVRPESTVTVTLASGWTAAAGTWRVESWTALAGDQRRTNDSLAKWVWIRSVPPTVTLTVPNGGEVWQVGSSHNITWTHGGGIPDGDSIWYRISDTDTWRLVATVGPGTTSYSWNPIPDTPSESCLVRVKAFNSSGSQSDLSDAYFTIVYQDVGATAILAPAGTLDSGSVVTPQAVVFNFGSRTETFPVTLRIGSVYDETVAGITLNPGQADTVDFPDWVVQPLGRHLTVSFTAFGPDQDRSNDTVFGEDSIEVIRPPRHDVGATVILAPIGTLDSGTVVTPRTVVQNFQTRTETFPVTFRIGSVYNQTVTGVTLVPGQVDTIDFPDWTAQPVGDHEVLSFTDLAGDEDRSNDTVFGEDSLRILYPPRHDVGATAILSPTGQVDSGWVLTPRAVVHNFGTRDEVFPVTFRVGGVYDETVAGVNLTPGQTDTISFPDWTAQPVGSYATLAFTALAGDEHPENDTVTGELEVLYPERHDVGATAILAPIGTLDSGTVITPRAVVQNFQTRTETFPVTFRIGSVYDETVTGVTLLPGQTDTVNFPAWTAQPVGDYEVLSFTDLVGDENALNDTAWAAESLHILYPPRHDVGATAILAPLGTLDSGTVVTPRAVVRNFQTRTETFPVTFRIGSVYDQTVTGVTLVPGEVDTIDFPNWVAQPLGDYEVLSFTDLTGDEDRSNDTVFGEDSLHVIYPPRHNVGATVILSPTGQVDSGWVLTPRAVVHNFGTRDEVFPVTFRVGSVYDETMTGVSLARGQSDTVSFPDWTAQPVGSYSTVAFTALTGDEHPENDTATGELEVLYPERHDVGATAILAPIGTIDSGTVVTPRAVVRNFQTRTETFPVTFRIGGVYDETVTGVTLVPGQVDTVAFPDWVAQPLGDYEVLSFTELDGDEDRSNDTVFGEDSLHVIYPPRHDVGATAILAPIGTLDSGTVVTPRAVVQNFQTRTETFPVTFRIGSVYDQTVTGVTLVPGQIDTIDFPNWTVQPLGRHLAVAFTNLSGDERRSNDTVFGADSINVIRPPRYDVGATAILAPLGTLDSGTVVTPRAVLYNYGTRDATFPVTFKIANLYSQTLNRTLTPGQTDTVSFPNWTAQPVGVHGETCYTALANDLNRRNDTARATVTIQYPPRHDVGATAILAPVGTLDSGTVVIPRAVVYNYGTRNETFPVTFTIGSAYSQTVGGITLTPGQTDTISFPDWTVQPLGRHLAVSFTALAGDERRANDTVYGADSITVIRPPRHDVGATAILAPVGTLDSGTTVTPTAVVYNYGTRDETFPVTFSIDEVTAPGPASGKSAPQLDNVYRETVQLMLTPGQTDTVSFPDWIAQPVGRYTTLSFTALAADENRANDTAYGALSDTLEVVYPERHDVSAAAILAPTGTLDSGTVVSPTAVVANLGTRNETFPVAFRIDGGYEERVQATLAPGAVDTLNFPAWTAQPVAVLNAAAFTELDTDRDRSNDTAAAQVTVLLPERHDVGATAILAPLGTLDSGTVVTPRSVVYNFGTRDEVFPVTFRIGGLYEQVVADVALAPGQGDTVSFPDWIAQPVGDYNVVSFTALAGDLNPLNDSVYGGDTLQGPDTVRVVYPERHDAAVTAIVAPLGTLDSATVVAPSAVVRNLGTRDETIPLTFTIGAGYRQSLELTLAPGQADTARFPDWAAAPLGQHAVVCYALLESDENRANDTATATLTVELAADVGCEAILAPVGETRLREGIRQTAAVPRVRVRNYGQQSATGFEVRLRIDSVRVGADTVVLGTAYEQTLTVGQVIEPGDGRARHGLRTNADRRPGHRTGRSARSGVRRDRPLARQLRGHLLDGLRH
jgi:hypothetical protein